MDKNSLLIASIVIFILSGIGGMMDTFSKKVAYPLGAIGVCLFLYAQFLCN